MSLEKVKQYFDSLGLGQRVHGLAQSSATVEEAAVAVGCEPAVSYTHLTLPTRWSV